MASFNASSSSHAHTIPDTWRYVSRGTMGFDNGALPSLVGFTFILDPNGPQVEEAILHMMIGDILFRGGPIATKCEIETPLPTSRITRHFYIRLGDHRGVVKERRLAGWTYRLEFGLTQLIEEQDYRYLRHVGLSRHQVTDNVGGLGRGLRSGTLSEAFEEMLKLTKTVFGKAFDKITAPSGGKPYETEEEEMEAVDGEI